MRADESHLKVFEDLRPQLTGLAYRMTGSLSDADDVLQDAWLRWSRVDAASVDAPKPYLLQIVARLCVDQATSARARREVYVGPWLPEPVVDPLAVGARPSAEQVAELADDLSVALLLVLKRLSPLERAALTDPLDGDGARVSLAASAELAAGWQAAADLLHQCNEGATP
jgi:RNA polymerase sigma-70 factor (ECF subfamily)